LGRREKEVTIELGAPVTMNFYWVSYVGFDMPRTPSIPHRRLFNHNTS
jgi:hypothetical protein